MGEEPADRKPPRGTGAVRRRSGTRRALAAVAAPAARHEFAVGVAWLHLEMHYAHLIKDAEDAARAKLDAHAAASV